MHHVSDAEDYASLKTKAKDYLGLVVHFSAGWCEPCKEVSKALEGYSLQYKDSVLFADVNAELLGDICEMESVECVPFVVFFRTSLRDQNQENVAEVAGAKLDEIELNMVSLYGSGTDGRDKFPGLDEYLTYLTSRKGVVAFITGTPSKPRCGFTGKLIDVFHELGIKFIYYDVWASDEVCEGLKAFSKWPTFPQIYVDGELIGGYDICVQLRDSGELKSTLKH